MTAEPIITTEELNFSYGGIPILADVNLSIHERDFVSIIGPNGGGKTTLLKIFLGILRPSSGKVLVFGKSPKQVRSMIGYMPQHTNYDTVFPVTVLDVVLMGRLGGKWSAGFHSKRDKEISLASLNEVGLADSQKRRLSELSGGQQQRVLIARALACEPKILLLDEPTSNLDYVVEGKFYELLTKLNKRMTIAVVSHDIGFVSNFVTRVICVNRNTSEHPVDHLSGGIIDKLYGGDMCFVRHDIDTTKTKIKRD